MQDFFPNNSNLKLEAALYIVATPIGNLRDITIRALEILQKADYIVCEDSRVTAKLLRHYEIKDKKCIIYNDFGDEKTREKILNFIIQGSIVALVSDAGTPLISDPGYKLVRYIRTYNQKVIPIPGASATISALCASGLACDNFLFLGFLPTTRIQRVNLFKSISKEYTTIFFESANRINDALTDIDNVFKDRNIVIAKELTKIHEEIISAKAKDLIDFFAINSDKLRGEFVIIIEKADKNERNISETDLIEEIKSAINSGFTIKELSQNLSEIYDLNKKEIYQLALKAKNSS
jgi:16S rRNA (cytidine1402-2'-O)-methyltransferase